MDATQENSEQFSKTIQALMCTPQLKMAQPEDWLLDIANLFSTIIEAFKKEKYRDKIHLFWSLGMVTTEGHMLLPKLTMEINNPLSIISLKPRFSANIAAGILFHDIAIYKEWNFHDARRKAHITRHVTEPGKKWLLHVEDTVRPFNLDAFAETLVWIIHG